MNSIPSRLSETGPNVANDAWVVTISVLEALTSLAEHADVEATTTVLPQRARKRRRRATAADVPAHYQPNATAEFVERVSERSILVNWCDSTSCHYCDQLWTRKSAHSAGFCALTGDVISRGDAVYGPYTRVAHPPVNEQAMILASSLEAIGN